MIQNFLADRVEELSKTKTLFQIKNDILKVLPKSKIKTSTLSRLTKHKTASIATCEDLLEFFATDSTWLNSTRSTLKQVKTSLDNDETLTESHRDLLNEVFATLYKKLQK